MQGKANKTLPVASHSVLDSGTPARLKARSGAANRHQQKKLEIREALNPGGLHRAFGLASRGSGLLLQRKSDYGNRSSNMNTPLVPSHVRSVMASPGRPLDRETRAFMEQRFSHDFSRVRVHDDGQAAESARTMAARAYTVGQDIAFAPGRYAPHSQAGRRLLAHELTHTIQQRGIQRSTGGITMPLATENQRYEQEADRAAAAIGSNGHLPALSRAGLPTLQLDGPNYNIRLTYPPDHTERHTGLPLVDALHVLKRFGDRVEAHLEGGLEGHRYLREIHEDQYVVSRISDVFGGRTFPPLTIWTTPRTYLIQGRAALGRADVRSATSLLQQAAQASRRAERTVYEYREGTIAGAERAIFALEVLEVAGSIAATVATGGTAGVFVGAGYAGAQRFAREASSVHFGLQDRIDWGGIIFDTFFGVVAGAAGGGIGAALARRLTVRLGSQVSANLVSSLVVGRLSAIVHAEARLLFDARRGQTQWTWAAAREQLVNQLSAQQIILDLVSHSLASATNRARSRQTPTAPSEPPATPVSRPPPQFQLHQGGDPVPPRMRDGNVVPQRRPTSSEGSAPVPQRGSALALARETLPVTEPHASPVRLVPPPAPAASAPSTPTRARAPRFNPVSAAVATSAATRPRGRNKPTGLTPALDDAIPMVWCKLPEYYQPTIVVAGHVYKIDERRRLPHGEIIGVRRRYRPYINKVLSLVPEPRDSSVVEGFRATLEEDYGFDWNGLQADHLQDVEWSGHDGWDNIWPIDRRHNASAGPRQNQHQRVTYYANYDSPNPFVNIRLTTAKRLPIGQRVLGRYFKIRAITG